VSLNKQEANNAYKVSGQENILENCTNILMLCLKISGYLTDIVAVEPGYYVFLIHEQSTQASSCAATAC
jgi:hypothetical protein